MGTMRAIRQSQNGKDDHDRFSSRTTMKHIVKVCFEDFGWGWMDSDTWDIIPFYCFKKLLVVLHFVANAYYHRQDHVLDEIQPSRRLKVCRDGVSWVRMVCRVYLRNNG